MLDEINTTYSASELETGTDIFAKAVNLAVAGQLTLEDLFKSAGTLQALQQDQLAATLYKTWIAFNPNSRLLYAAYFNYATVLTKEGDQAGATAAYLETIRLNPTFAPPYINLGRVLEDTGNISGAVTQWVRLLEQLAPVKGEAVTHKLSALQQIGRVLEAQHADIPAEDALRQAIEIDPNQPEVIQHWLSPRQRQCKWPLVTELGRAKKKELIRGMSTLSLSYYSDDPMFQLAKAHLYNVQTVGVLRPVARPKPDSVTARRRASGKLRIGYVSSDLRDHAVGFAMTDVVETHDKEQFEIFAYYCGIKRPDPTQTRIKTAVDQWTDINDLSDDQAALKIAADNIDILVDLNGYTKDSRTKVFARRPAPVIVNWFGYPGSMASPYHHYLIADPYIVPESHEIYYSEKILRLPCYQPNDRKRTVAPNRPSRKDAGLPEDAFVYCSLNGSQKLTRRTFERWMSILAQVPDSVLWLLGAPADANERLRQRAVHHGVAAERLVFAERALNPDHLARYPLADLFLDSMPYGAHTTAADAMWMGVPILTLPGRSFASRVCGSLVRAAGIEELVCDGPEDYVARAIAFGRDRAKLAPIRQKLMAGRETCLLFDTPKLVHHLEALYRQMWQEHEDGRLPRPNLRNLDVYGDIGLELDLEAMELLDDQAYRALYMEKLAMRDEFYPLDEDGRFWRGGAA